MHFPVGRARATALTALVLVSGWLWLVAPLLTGTQVPRGSEYPVHITHFAAWQHARACGACLFWEHTGGGVPFFGDPYTAAQHPLAAVLTLLTDPITGANLTIAAALLVLGGAGWLYARTFSYPLVPTLWVVGLLLYGGHAVGRLAVGSVALPLAVAFFALTAVLVVRWVLVPTWERLLALTLAVAGLALSGQGYLQLLAVCWAIPVTVIAARRMPLRTLVSAAATLIGGVGVLCARAGRVLAAAQFHAKNQR